MDIVNKYGIVLDGWPLKDFVSPSKIGTMKTLEKLATALEGVGDQEPTCSFRKLTNMEYKAHQVEHAAKAAHGETAEQVHKEHSDKGVSHGPYKGWQSEGEDAASERHEKQKNDMENNPSRKRRKVRTEVRSREIINSDEDNV